MLGVYTSHNRVDASGNPTGGEVRGIGLSIDWQNGPLGRDGDRKAPNGAFVETVIDAVIDRLKFYQDSKFKCEENHLAIGYLIAAAQVLDSRTKNREARKVEGTHAA